MFSDSLVWTSPSGIWDPLTSLILSSSSHCGLGRDFPEKTVPWKNLRRGRILGPSPSQKDGGGRRIALSGTFLQCSARSELYRVRAIKLCLKTPWFSRIVWPVPPKTDALRAELTQPVQLNLCPTGNLLLLWISSPSDCKVQMLALVKPTLH